MNFLIFIIFLSQICFSNELKLERKKLIDLDFSGYTKLDAFFDSRQTIDFRNGEVLLYPAEKIFDQCGASNSDLNDKSQFNMVVMQTSLKLDIKGPPIDEIKINGSIEADFLGIYQQAFVSDFARILADTTDSMFHLTKSYFTLEWEKLNLLFGKFPHPLSIEECIPNVISANSGNPIESEAKAIQIRFSYLEKKNYELLLAAINQAVGASDSGVNGETPKYLRDASIPNLHFQFKKYLTEKNIIWFCFDFKRIIPRLFIDENEFINTGCKVKESLNSCIVSAAYSHNSEKNRICVKAIYSQDGIMHGLMGGYGVSDQNPDTGQRQYTNLNAFSIWFDFEHTHQNFKPGFFVGFAKNLGASQNLFNFSPPDQDPSFITFTIENAEKIDNVFRFSPRLVWEKKKVRFAGELEYTRASYGTLISSGQVIDHEPVSNIRFLFAAYYLF